MAVQMTLADENAEYAAFVEKFKPKKTTDDCYTPEVVYETVADWVSKEYGIDRADMVRPFWPGGDYQRHEYPDGCCVVDNPPFSILAEIKRFYLDHGVHFFLFAPNLTLFSGLWDERQCYYAMNAQVTYENGAVVQTAFVTDLDDTYLVRTEPELCRLINEANERNVKSGKVSLPKYVYPLEVLTAARAAWMSGHNTDFRVRKGDACRIQSLDAQRPQGKVIFGGGLLLSERAAAERAAAERAAAERAAAERAAAERAAAEMAEATRWPLSDRERAMQKLLAGEE